MGAGAVYRPSADPIPPVGPDSNLLHLRMASQSGLLLRPPREVAHTPYDPVTPQFLSY